MENHKSEHYNRRILEKRAIMEGQEISGSDSMLFSMEVTPKKFSSFQIVRFPENMRATKFDTLGAMMRFRKSFLEIFNPTNVDDYLQL